ncbi:MAG: hypothetical protein AAGB29_14310 [Planctomycetota bacterium]
MCKPVEYSESLSALLNALRGKSFFYQRTDAERQLEQIPADRYTVVSDIDLSDIDQVNRYRESFIAPGYFLGDYCWDDVVQQLGDRYRDLIGEEKRHECDSLMDEYLDVIEESVDEMLFNYTAWAIPDDAIYELIELVNVAALHRLLVDTACKETEEVLSLIRCGFHVFGWIGKYPESGGYAVYPLFVK